ncbi:hypothetical protein HYDPIDRAFT_84041 [Hydnomerulius pinastri MD-312]|nr:hypothetical protein HYDPIDRAFT_84041 [Hydnomerulius pinastri MD-312]
MDISDYEEGEFIDESYDELEPTTSQSTRRTRGGGKPGGYQLKNVLKLPRATTYSTQALYDQIVASDIDLEPEYQRDVVWPESKQIGLIDSILRNFYIPPVIFVTHQHEDGSESKTCIDGKQRLTSIQRFMDGLVCPISLILCNLISYNCLLAGEKYWYKSTAVSQTGRSPGMLLPDKYLRLFANKQIVCIEYQDLPDSDEREIFQRVQLGMALTPAEKLQVLNTPMSAFVRKLQAQYFDSEGPLGGDALDWDRSRGGDFRCIAQALYTIAKFPTSTSIAAIAQLEKWLHNPTTKASTHTSFIDRVHTTFRLFSNLVGDASLRPTFLKPEWRVSPVEFVMMCLLISVDMDNLSPREIAEKIGAMRVQVRKEHVDIRMNSRVAKTLFDFIKGNPPAAAEMDTTRSGGKRKREADEDVEHSRKGKDRKPVEPASSPRTPTSSMKSALTSARNPTSTPAPTRSQVSSVPPPRPDRLHAVREAKHTIAPVRVSSPKPLPTGPAALRGV